jgi:hypothetical protein
VIKKTLFYFVVFLMSLVFFLVALFPANILWQQFLSSKMNLAASGVTVAQVEGTVWEGQALIHYRELAGIVSWRARPQGLLGLSLPIDLQIVSTAGKLTSMIDVGADTLGLRVSNAEIQLAALNPVVRQQRVTLDGMLLIKDLDVALQNMRPVRASGMASWSGGDIAYPAGREIHQRNLPVFRADLSTRDEMIRLVVRDAQATFDVVSASLDANGEGLMSVTRRLLDLSREPWSQNSREQDVVFKVKKQLF